MEKVSFLTRRPCFWVIQGVGLFCMLTLSIWLKLSLPSVLIGVILSYVNMEILFRFFRPKGSFLLFSIKNLIFLGTLYMIIDYLDGLSLLLGLGSMILCLIGLSYEVLKYDSL